MLPRIFHPVAFVVCVVTAAAAPARAAGLDAQAFTPAAGVHDYFSVRGTDTVGHLRWALGFVAHYSNDPLVLRRGDALVRRSVSDLLTADLTFALGCLDIMQFDLALPLHLYVAGSGLGPGQAPPVAGVGDLRFQPRFRLYDLAAGRLRFALAAAADLTLPFGQWSDRLFGSPSVTFAPQLLVELRGPYVRTAFNFGYRFAVEERVRDLALGDELLFGFALAARPGTDFVELTAELSGAAASKHALRAGTRPIELLGGVRLFPGLGFTVLAGAGGGISGGASASDFRLFAGLGYAPERALGPSTRAPRDRDGDGLDDDHDECVADPEDPDLFDDGDGCPDPDNDRDGVADPADACPVMAEDRDSFADDDGCPDPDNDGDGIADVDDRCPFVAENLDGCEDDDGCPETKGACVADDGIVILDRIRFVFGTAKIERDSYSVLNEVARILKQHKEIKKVRIEGHTDDVGRKLGNLQLSRRRAEAVHDFLVRVGVEKGRLEHEGYGDTRPLVPNVGPAERARNRRVEFIIVESE